MAIHPQYAQAILDGRKQVEFRKRPLAADVRTVVIYATAPVKKIVGEFVVGDIVMTDPSALWSSLGAVGAIDEQDFRGYYAGAGTAAGIIVQTARRYRAPVDLTSLRPAPSVPQSFAYLPADLLAQIRRLGTPTTRPIFTRLLGPLVTVLRRVVFARPLAPVITLPLSPDSDARTSHRASVRG
jgi:predicted transcriptional regulator